MRRLARSFAIRICHNSSFSICAAYIVHNSIARGYLSYLSALDTISRAITLLKMFLSPSEKGSSLKGKNFFPFRVDPFQKGLGLQESKQDHKSCLPCENDGKHTQCVSSANGSSIIIDNCLSIETNRKFCI